MGRQPLTDAAGSPVRYGGVGEGSGALTSLVCPDCGYAELRAVPGEEAAGPDEEAGSEAEALAEALGIGAVPSPEGNPLEWSVADREAFMKAQTAQYRRAQFARLSNVAATGEVRPMGPLMLIAIALTAGLAAAGVTLLYKMSGPIMELGGMVASGGPYEIAHPAPEWAPLVVMGFVIGLFAFFANLFVAAKYGRPNLILPFWAAIFGSQGWNFLYYGWVDPPGGDKVITWIVLGVMFWLMAAPAVVLMLVPDTWRGFSGAFGIATLIGVVAGVLLAVQLFAAVAV